MFGIYDVTTYPNLITRIISRITGINVLFEYIGSLEGGGVCSEPQFLILTRCRAENIDCHRDRYDVYCF